MQKYGNLSSLWNSSPHFERFCKNMRKSYGVENSPFGFTSPDFRFYPKMATETPKPYVISTHYFSLVFLSSKPSLSVYNRIHSRTYGCQQFIFRKLGSIKNQRAFLGR